MRVWPFLVTTLMLQYKEIYGIVKVTTTQQMSPFTSKIPELITCPYTICEWAVRFWHTQCIEIDCNYQHHALHQEEAYCQLAGTTTLEVFWVIVCSTLCRMAIKIWENVFLSDGSNPYVTWQLCHWAVGLQTRPQRVLTTSSSRTSHHV